MDNTCTVLMSIRVQVREEAKKAEALQSVPQSTICYVAITYDGTGVMFWHVSCNLVFTLICSCKYKVVASWLHMLFGFENM